MSDYKDGFDDGKGERFDELCKENDDLRAKFAVAIEHLESGLAASEKELKELRAKLAAAEEALQNISDPIAWMTKNVPDGSALNGLVAVSLSQDPAYLKEIAAKALDAMKEQT